MVYGSCQESSATSMCRWSASSSASRKGPSLKSLPHSTQALMLQHTYGISNHLILSSIHPSAQAILDPITHNEGHCCTSSHISRQQQETATEASENTNMYGTYGTS
ncbi:hypothetical protein Vafri_7098 [Volvox africanus]|uniref:Uncharacterized protein n=1 Tax=Volvox africanus TaxID=51714 RepID=A0A8J4EXW0_9CHLO|nr:hypothetical protein Vafri_7098 [Volvox africanus]